MNVHPVQTNARGNQVWNNVKERVENVLTSVADVLMSAEKAAATLHKY